MSVLIYVEGGGDQEAACSQLRQGFRAFFQKALRGTPLPRFVACGSRQRTYDRFRTALREHPTDVVFLLVDSEDPVTVGTPAWEHLRMRDGWDRPAIAKDDQAHLMVQCMEAWFLADKESLAAYYGQGFRRNALPSRKNVESIAKIAVFKALENATRDTGTKGRYHKTAHGFELLARIDPSKVCQASAHAAALRDVLLRATSRETHVTPSVVR